MFKITRETFSGFGFQRGVKQNQKLFRILFLEKQLDQIRNHFKL